MTPTLNDLIRQVAADNPAADPREIADLVAQATPKRELVDFYASALVAQVRTIFRYDRASVMGREPVKQSNRSPKRDAIRSWWASMLTTRHHVGNSEWKLLGDCTIDDLSFCVTERREQIKNTEAVIADYERLIALMSKHKAQTVSELPAQDRW